MRWICKGCLLTPEVGAFDDYCIGGMRHRMVVASVTECPHVTRTPTGRVSYVGRRRADKKCESGAHHFGDDQRRHFEIKVRRP